MYMKTDSNPKCPSGEIQEQVWFDSLRASQTDRDREHNIKKVQVDDFSQAKSFTSGQSVDACAYIQYNNLRIYGLIFNKNIITKLYFIYVQLVVYFVITYKLS